MAAQNLDRGPGGRFVARPKHAPQDTIARGTAETIRSMDYDFARATLDRQREEISRLRRITHMFFVGTMVQAGVIAAMFLMYFWRT